MFPSDFRNETELGFFDTNSRDSGFEEINNLEGLEEDAFLEEFAEIAFSKRPQLPTDFINLIQKPIITVTVNQKPTFRRAISHQENVSPLKKKICQRDDNDDSKNFLIRRKKLTRLSKTEEFQNTVPRDDKALKPFNSEEIIKTAIQRSCSEDDLIADFSKSCSLPLTTSRHQDLKAINSSTLERLINGEFSDNIGSFKIIDCRYPYEYNGGHIKGAINIYTHEDCSSLLEASDKPSILIFHCEFSAERGPNLYRHLRHEDRKKNAHMYPSLCFPEMYILEGGYKQFFENNSQMCSPVSYTQMLHPEYTKELTFYRQTSRTWDADVKCCNKKSLKSRNGRKIF
ncbi:M-phase inducer phosphatase-like [Anthonomus grandis grandis]|uniref:M-phase inducer phosphatase-like n=1 Tax=Anthonomus grandis grandis TaxID=2921223 RepID=UPI0021660A55|nr:M-phase inducer phosphatase-like [Anthonomus grandis grandis]